VTAERVQDVSGSAPEATRAPVHKPAGTAGRRTQGQRAPRRSGQIPGGRHGLAPEAVAESQRARLLAGVAAGVAEHGYAETSIADVIARAGVSRKTFYEQFSSKDECLLAIYDEAAQCLRGVVQRAYERGVTPRERIDAALDIVLEWVDAEPGLARLCMLEVPSIGLEGQKRVAATTGWLSGVMTDILADLDVPELLPELIVGGIHQMLIQRLVNDTSELPTLATDLTEVWSFVERAAA
jgi:AcrR family transcriptional regulator